MVDQQRTAAAGQHEPDCSEQGLHEEKEPASRALQHKQGREDTHMEHRERKKEKVSAQKQQTSVGLVTAAAPSLCVAAR